MAKSLRQLLLVIVLVAGVQAKAKQQLKNVLFLAVDDLRPELGA